MIRIAFAGSGSKGNATLITDGETLIQIDMGVSRKALKNALSLLGKSLEDIEAVFITHDHFDHVGTLPLLDSSTLIYATPCSLDPKDVFETLIPGVGISVGHFMVLPFSVSHDAPNPVNFLITNGNKKLGYVTDTGLLSEEALEILRDCDYYLFESNHDLEMLWKSHRPQSLKERIHGDQGHLSNADSALYFASVCGPHTKAVYLGHISEECNTPSKAVDTYRRILEAKGMDPSRIEIVPTKQWEPMLGGDLE